MFQGLLLVLTLCVLSISSLEKCQLSSGERGKCIDIEKCPFALSQLQSKIPPETCGFNGTTPIVCCIDNNLFHNIDGKGTNVFCALGYPEGIIRNEGIGGVNSLPREFRHMAALGYVDGNETVWGCGGTLITKRHVLTAAHCLHSRNLGDVAYVRLGDLNLRSNKDNALPQDFLVAKKIKHPDYRPPTQYHDIAIIELDKDAELNYYVSTACLNIDREINRTTFLATGWGQIGYGGDLADHLQKMKINLVHNDECSKGYEKVTKRRLPGGIKDDLQICAGAPNVDTCPGDSGGPLQINTYMVGVVYGITSFGIACGISRSPGIYTRVSNYIDWIKSNVS